MSNLRPLLPVQMSSNWLKLIDVMCTLSPHISSHALTTSRASFQCSSASGKFLYTFSRFSKPRRESDTTISCHRTFVTQCYMYLVVCTYQSRPSQTNIINGIYVETQHRNTTSRYVMGLYIITYHISWLTRHPKLETRLLHHYNNEWSLPSRSNFSCRTCSLVQASWG